MPGNAPSAISTFSCSANPTGTSYDALSTTERRLGRSVEATIRNPDWLESGTDTFHYTVVSRPMLKLDLSRP
jgi:hypothetical protein